MLQSHQSAHENLAGFSEETVRSINFVIFCLVIPLLIRPTVLPDPKLAATKGQQPVGITEDVIYGHCKMYRWEAAEDMNR